MIQEAIRGIEQGVSLGALVSFGWSLRRHFFVPRRPPVGLLALTITTFTGYAWFCMRLWHVYPESLFDALALSGFTGCLVLFWKAVRVTHAYHLGVAYAGHRSIQIVQQGPYALVRHPFYLSYGIFWTSTALAVGREQWIVALIFLAWYVKIAYREEATILSGPSGRDYASYKSRTGMLLPRWPVITSNR